MADREKVIKESEEAIDILAKAEEPTFLLDFVRCAFENALELLKEQKKQLDFYKKHEHEVCENCPYKLEDIGDFSDGYHTFNDLYTQRAVLFATIVN